MKLTRNVFTIADLNIWMEGKSLVVNDNYQRGKGLWPLNARSFFIDTILNGFPFPKITIRQTVDLATKQSIREIIDGQQRMMTINDFINGKLVLSGASHLYKGKIFSDLDEDARQSFLAYEVSIDTVLGASQSEVLEVFRRMNSYTIPLNEPEKRHATYQGEFKWFIKDMIDLYSPMFGTYGILSVREVSRMLDADLMTELCQVLVDGVFGRRAARLENLYRANEKNFTKKKELQKKLMEVLDFIKVELNTICSHKILKSYSLYSLFSALVYNKWGIANLKGRDFRSLRTIGTYSTNINSSIQNILELFMAVDQREGRGKFAEFVKASMATTHGLANRITRLKWLVSALQGKL